MSVVQEEKVIQLQLLQKIGILAISIMLGYAYYFFISGEKRRIKWQNGNMLASQLVHFIICLDRQSRDTF